MAQVTCQVIATLEVFEMKNRLVLKYSKTYCSIFVKIYKRVVILTRVNLNNFKVLHRRDGRVGVVLAFWRRKLGSISESVKSAQVTIDLPPMQSCTVCLGTNRCNGFSRLATPKRY